MVTIDLAPPSTDRAAKRPAAARRGPRLQRVLRRDLTGYLFLAGAVICFAFFSWYPIYREIVMSFQKTNFAGTTTWVGSRNYSRVNADPEFWSAWRNTVYFTLLALVFGYVVPFVMAIVLNEVRHVQSYFRLLIYLPVMMPPAAAAFLFQWFYDPGDGLFKHRPA